MPDPTVKTDDAPQAGTKPAEPAAPPAPAVDDYADIEPQHRERVRQVVKERCSYARALSDKQLAIVVELAAQRQQEIDTREREPAPVSKEPEEAEEEPPASAKPKNADLRKEVADLRRKLEDREARETAERNKAAFDAALSAALDGHELTKDDPDVRDTIHKAVMADHLLTRRSLAELVRERVMKMTERDKRQAENYITRKTAAAARTLGEAGAGGTRPATVAAPKPDDLSSGRIAQEIKAELGLL